jgi:hypothetical protein
MMPMKESSIGVSGVTVESIEIKKRDVFVQMVIGTFVSKEGSIWLIA